MRFLRSRVLWYALIPTIVLVVTVSVLLLAFGQAQTQILALTHSQNQAQTQTSKHTCDGHTGFAFCLPFSKTWKFQSGASTKHIIVDFTFTGHIGYNRRGIGTEPGVWKNQTILDPVLTATAIEQTLNPSPNVLTKFTMAQLWKGYECTFNPQFFVSNPWTFGLGFWPSCHNRNRAVDATSYGKGTTFSQSNTRNPIGIEDYQAPNQKPWLAPCYGVFLSSTIWVGNNSDSYISNVKQVCLPNIPHSIPGN